MPKVARFTLLAFIALAAVLAADARAAVQMPIGFYDDVSFRWSPDRMQNLQQAAAAGASIIHTTANWPQIAPTRPAHAANGDDPAYHLGDLDELVQQASLDGMRVMININGTPKWANGGQSPNRMPKHVRDLTTFARMLATRYNGYTGHGTVSLYSVWNEPNLSLFLTPQYAVKKVKKKGKVQTKFTIVGPRNYATLLKAAYAGIKAGNPLAKVAAGETSARGRDKPGKTSSDSVAPGTFAHLLSLQKGVRFDAWAHHPYPTEPSMKPLQKVRYPNVTLSTISRFEKDLHRWYHHDVPVWITEYGHETKPAEPKGVTLSKQAAWARQALAYARKDPNIQMFIWFTFRDSTGNPWQSGLLNASGTPKPAYAKFGALARLIDGQTFDVKAKRWPVVRVFLPTLFYYQGPGGYAGTTYNVYEKGTRVAVGQESAHFAGDGSLLIPLKNFTPTKGHTYSVSILGNEVNGHEEGQNMTLVGS